MTPQNYLRLGLLALTLIGCFKLGSSLKQAEWDRTENDRLREVTAELDRYKREVDDINDELSERTIALAASEQAARDLNDALQTEINREPVTTIVTVEREDCPTVSFYVPDSAEYYRLWNCGISGDCDATAAATANSGNGEVPATSNLAPGDGNP